MYYSIFLPNFTTSFLNRTTALSVRRLVSEGVTHILNAAMACSDCESKDICGTCVCTINIQRIGNHMHNNTCKCMQISMQVLTKPSYYSHSGIQFKGVQAHDEKRFPIYRNFEESTKFIDDALKKGGIVYVHCQQGISRSATLIIAYLMMKKSMSAKEAVRTVRYTLKSCFC